MKILKIILWAVFGSMMLIGMELLGSRLYPGTWAIPAFIACVAALAAIDVFSVIRIVRENKGGKTDVEAEYRQAVDRRKDMEADPEPERRKVLRLEQRVWLTWTAMILLCIGTGFLCGAAFGFGGEATAAVNSMVGIFMLPGLLRFLFCRPSLMSVNPDAELDEKEFPMLFGLVRESAEKMNYGRRLRLFLGDESIGVFRERDFDGMLLPPLLAELMTREELGQVFMHEFSHLTEDETDAEARWLKLLVRRARMSDVPCILGTLPVQMAAERFERRMKQYRMLAERMLEHEADSRAMSGENARAAVSAIAKSGFYLRFCAEDRASTFRIYEPESAEPNLTSVRREVLGKMLRERGERWLEDMENELPSLFDSHPTFRQRREALGVAEYDAFARETDEAWLSEMRRLCAKEDECHVRDPEYADARNRFYVHRKEEMENFDRAENPFETLEPEALHDAARAFYGLNDEKALGILRKMIEREPKDLLSKLMMGAWLLESRDESGLDMLYEVAENGNYTSSALDSIAEYVYRSGKTELVETYEARMNALVQQSLDFHAALDDVKLKDLKSMTLSRELLDELVKEMVARGEGNLAEIGCAARALDESEDAHVFVLKYASEEDEDLCEKIYMRIFQYLDQRTETYALLQDSTIPIDKMERTIPGSRVYQK